MDALHLFRDKHLLIVEERELLTAACCERLVSAGARIAGPVMSLGDAKQVLATTAIDAAILDLTLDDRLVIALAKLLDTLKIPFVFVVDALPNPIGFSLVDDTVELGKIATILFCPPPSETVH